MTTESFCLGGTIRGFPKDFVVEEVWDSYICKVEYSTLEKLKDQIAIRIQKRKNYLHFTLVKENWDVMRALKYVGRKTHASLKSFGRSGMKDKRALTAQRISLWKGRAGFMAGLKLHDIFLKNFRYADERITLGNAIGNRFTITIREIPRSKKEIEEIFEKFRKKLVTQGIPNYYGPQRLSGGNAEVGGALKNSNLKLAVEIILEKVQSLKYIPRVFWYEKKMVRYLEKHPNDYAGTLRKIPKKIRKIYTHAYQSNIFNEKLKQALLINQTSETIFVEGFNVPSMPELSTYTIERRSFIKTSDFRIIQVKDGFAIIRFTLNSGEYASTLLAHLLGQ